MKKQKKPCLKIRLTRAWLVEVVDQDDCEIAGDWCFGTRENAMAEGKRLKSEIIKDGRYSGVPEG